MTYAWKDQLAGIGDHCGHVIGILAIDGFVVVSIGDPRRHLDMAQLIVGAMAAT
jgi:hypothetical protein